MKFFLDYFGLAIFCFVLFIGGIVALPELGAMPTTPPGEILGLTLSGVVIAGGFSWYYFAASDQEGRAGRPPGRRPPRE